LRKVAYNGFGATPSRRPANTIENACDENSLNAASGRVKIWANEKNILEHG
jgi:hypothetical protein